jgi:hypothetical protein
MTSCATNPQLLLTLVIGVLLWKSSNKSVLVLLVMLSYDIACHEAEGQANG